MFGDRSRLQLRGNQVVGVLERLLKDQGPPKHWGRQRSRVRVQGARPLGLSQWCRSGLQSARQANRQLLRGILQRSAPRRMPQHTLVLIDRGHPRQDSSRRWIKVRGKRQGLREKLIGTWLQT